MGFWRSLFGWLPFVKPTWEIEFEAIKQGNLPDFLGDDFNVEIQAQKAKYKGITVFLQRLADEDKLIRILGALQIKKAGKVQVIKKAAKAWAHLANAKNKALKPIKMAYKKMAASAATESGHVEADKMKQWVLQVEKELQAEINENNAEIVALDVARRAVQEQLTHAMRYVQFLNDDITLIEQIQANIRAEIAVEQKEGKDLEKMSS